MVPSHVRLIESSSLPLCPYLSLSLPPSLTPSLTPSLSPSPSLPLFSSVSYLSLPPSLSLFLFLTLTLSLYVSLYIYSWISVGTLNTVQGCTVDAENNRLSIIAHFVTRCSWAQDRKNDQHVRCQEVIEAHCIFIVLTLHCIIASTQISPNPSPSISLSLPISLSLYMYLSPALSPSLSLYLPLPSLHISLSLSPVAEPYIFSSNLAVYFSKRFFVSFCSLYPLVT